MLAFDVQNMVGISPYTRARTFHTPEAFEAMIRIALIVLSVGFLSRTITCPSLATEPDARWQFTDIEGKLHKPFDEKRTRGIALVFISTDCPIANRYQPLLQRLAKTHAEEGIRFFMIHPDREITVDQARRHASEFKINVPVVIDTDQSIARRVAATVTPQAFVFARDQEMPVYQGRIDNLYAGYGKKRNAATTREFADALDAVIAGRPAKQSKTEAVGCFIFFAD